MCGCAVVAYVHFKWNFNDLYSLGLFITCVQFKIYAVFDASVSEVH